MQQGHNIPQASQREPNGINYSEWVPGILTPLVEGLIQGFWPSKEPQTQTIVVQTPEKKTEILDWLPWIAVGGLGLYVLRDKPMRRRKRRRRR